MNRSSPPPSGRTPIQTANAQESERAHLEAMALGAVDPRIERLSPDARRLLWVATRAFEPVSEKMLAGAWTTAETAPADPLLAELTATGLLRREEDGAQLGFDELVAQLAADWMARHPGELGERTEAGVWRIYGELYGEQLGVLSVSGTLQDRDSLVLASKRAIRYLERVQAFDELGDLTMVVFDGSNELDPAVLGELIDDLRAVTDRVYPAEAGWYLRGRVADALSRLGRPEEALELYRQVAEAAGAASDMGWIWQSWANSLKKMGQLDAAKAVFLRGAQVSVRANEPRLEAAVWEIAASSMAVDGGRAAEALPAIEALLTEVRGWWTRWQSGESVPEAPDEKRLAQAMMKALNLAAEAYAALERWTARLEVLEEIEAPMRSVGLDEHAPDVASTRFDRFTTLWVLGRLDEAKEAGLACLEVFRGTGKVGMMQALTCSHLGRIEHDLGDHEQAIAMERHALAAYERLSSPDALAFSHQTLAAYLGEAGQDAEARDHKLVELAYGLRSGVDLSTSLEWLSDQARNAADGGEPFVLPRLADLLAKPAFAHLCNWLNERGAALEPLQADIDERVNQVRS